MKQRMIKLGCISLLMVSMLLSQTYVVAADKSVDIIDMNEQSVNKTESYIAVVEDSVSYQELEKIADR